jgi:hypothetical protein
MKVLMAGAFSCFQIKYLRVYLFSAKLSLGRPMRALLFGRKPSQSVGLQDRRTGDRDICLM